MLRETLAAALGLAAAVLLTWLARRVALRKQVLDVPGERSMHRTPTPRGGGLAIVLVTLTFLGIQTLGSDLDRNILFALLGGGTAVAAVGFLDDLFTLGNRIRMAIWFPAAAWAVYCLGGFPTLDLGTIQVPLGIAGSVLAVIGIVWLTNLYNFMDGIDGLAGGQAVVVGGSAAGLLFLTGAASLAAVPLVLAAAAAGFLVWNWPPAKIFMGDVGSGFIGYVFAVLSLASARAEVMPLPIWSILLAVFLVDTTLTVARRMLRRERWFEAHRSHAYQVAASRWGHLRVTSTILAIDLALVGVAFAAWSNPRWMLPLMILVFVLLGILWWTQVRTLSKGEPMHAAPAAATK